MDLVVRRITEGEPLANLIPEFGSGDRHSRQGAVTKADIRMFYVLSRGRNQLEA